MTSKNVMTVLSRALNLLDYRIVDHGQRVAYILYKLLEKENRYSKTELHKICFLGALHDIGAFKTEEIDTLVDENAMDFELRQTIGHSAYGYLFLKNFSMLSDYADAILFHHFRYDRLDQTECQNKDLAAKLFVIDRIDILFTLNKLKIDDKLFSQYRDSVFSAKDIDLIIALEQEIGLTEKLANGSYLAELSDVYDQCLLTEEELLSFLKTLSFLIDFRSEYTFLHTLTAVNFSVEIAKLMGLSESEIKQIYYGALLHDVGKISTSILVLEKSENLDDYEYTIMKDHVVVSERILKDCVDDVIFNIAVRHHEKLDGTGYPHGLIGAEMTCSEKIMASADILSALHGKRSYKEAFQSERIKEIMKTLAEQNKLSPEVVTALLNHYETIVETVETNGARTVAIYNQMKKQYRILCDKYER